MITAPQPADDQLPIDPQAHAVVRIGRETVQPAGEIQRAGPAHREVAGVDHVPCRGATTPVEILSVSFSWHTSCAPLKNQCPDAVAIGQQRHVSSTQKYGKFPGRTHPTEDETGCVFCLNPPAAANGAE